MKTILILHLLYAVGACVAATRSLVQSRDLASVLLGTFGCVWLMAAIGLLLAKRWAWRVALVILACLILAGVLFCLVPPVMELRGAWIGDPSGVGLCIMAGLFFALPSTAFFFFLFRWRSNFLPKVSTGRA
jgi:hypothetical protein